MQRVGGACLCAIAPAGNTAPIEEMSQRWQAVGNTVSKFTGPRFEPQASRSRINDRVTAGTQAGAFWLTFEDIWLLRTAF